jgi:hypothetical protein
MNKMIGLVILWTAVVANAGSPAPAQTFVAPEDAVKALAAAADKQDTDAIRALFGPATDDVINPDRVQARNDFEEFAAALKVTNRLAKISDRHLILEVGNDFWPFPIPLTRLDDSRWFFDTAAGKEELLNRRIGRNELATLKVVRGYVEAQREYASRDRMGDEVLQYAQKFESSPGKKNGLFWPESDGEVSPIGPFVARAQGEGYSKKDGPAPYHGYFYKILTRQGKNAPGGAYNYIINGRMIAGFALVAWPAEYGESGVMTFIVNQQGRVYQKDLGAKTAARAKAMKSYDPDTTWAVSPD